MQNKSLCLLVLATAVFGLLAGGCKKPESSNQDSAGTQAVAAKKYHCSMHPTYVSDKPGDCPICNMKLVPIQEGESPSSAPTDTGQTPAQAVRYTCTMHPTYISDKPGDCPTCNMKLVPLKEAEPTGGAQTNKVNAPAKVARYHCPMHPNYVSDKPGDCPICNMKLVPIKEEAGAANPGAEPAAVSSVPGRVAFTLSAEKQQLIGLRTVLAEKRELSAKIRTTATIEHDETKFSRIAPRFSGWVRDLKINYTGQTIEKGAPLLTVYSPELLSAENEYLLAFQRFQHVKSNTNDFQFEGAKRLVESARRRLFLWEIGDEEIHALEQSGQPKDELLLRSPVSGHVISKVAIEGKSFTAGETLYEIADIHHLWLRAYVYEYELPLIKVGQKARVILSYLGNKVYDSTVTFIYPHIEQQTRRAQIRLEVDNSSDHELRPQMWANVEIDASFGNVLTVPASAVIDTGTRYVGFVQKDKGYLEPRELTVGIKTDDYYEVRGGIAEGEKVVARALFLVDSESQLKAAIAGMSNAGAAPQ